MAKNAEMMVKKVLFQLYLPKIRKLDNQIVNPLATAWQIYQCVMCQILRCRFISEIFVTSNLVRVSFLKFVQNFAIFKILI